MKKRLTGFAAALLLLAACGDDSEPADETDPPEETEQAEEQIESEADDLQEEAEEQMEESVLVGSVNDVEPIPISDYPEENWFRLEMEDEHENWMVSEAFIEEDMIYAYTERNNARAFSTDSSVLWEVENQYPVAVDLVIGADIVYNAMIASTGKESYIQAIHKQDGEMLFQIDLEDEEELGELFVDDDGLYFITGKKSDPDDTFADTFTLWAYDAEDGTEEWAEEIDGLRLGGERANYYQIAANDELLYYIEADNKLIARSKEDGKEVWSEQLENGTRYAYPFISDDSVYILDGDYVFHVFDPATGEKLAEYDYGESQVGQQIPPPVFQGDRVFYQHINLDEEKQYIKAADVKVGSDAWMLDLDGHYAFGVKLLNDDELILLLGDLLDEEAGNPTKVAKIDPDSGDVLEVIELEDKLSRNFSSMYKGMGHTVHDGVISVFYQNVIYGIK